jgi:type II restriction enzyme
VVGAIPFRETISDDAILIKRRKLEVSLFHAIERKHVIPTITSGFKTVEAFMEVALQVANRRKARAGQSLELNLNQIFLDRKLRFETQAITENKKKPDFLFPSKSDYDNSLFPVKQLHMLAAKTCCKERWRQVLSEANRIPTKHLFTLQEGTTEPQLREMYDNGIVLVVPQDNISAFPVAWRTKIYSLASFVNEMKTEQVGLADG